MSFQDKLAAIMARPGQDPNAKDDVSWWMKYAGRIVGSIAGFVAIFLGVWNCVAILLGGVWCLLGGIWQIVAGFIVICCEAPCCCMFVDHVQKISDFVDRRPYWNRAVGYVSVAIPAIIFCPGFSSIIGSGLIFATGIIYGMMALGKKASAEEMRQAASLESSATNRPISMQQNLVLNAQPIGLSPAPIHDSNFSKTPFS